MLTRSRQYSFLDRLIGNFDLSLRTLFSTSNLSRPNPAQTLQESPMNFEEVKKSAGLMRVNHAGEVCAQALYQGQAMTARSKIIREKMQQSALEENDHLIWCKQRLGELNSHTSYLNPIWYSGSFLIGVLAGIVSDQFSLGFVAETERQVVEHLNHHLQELPANDEKSRKVLEQMREDEMHHATVAHEIGAEELSIFIQQTMAMMSKIMTTVAYRI